jgi:hypothetical protein
MKTETAKIGLALAVLFSVSALAQAQKPAPQILRVVNGQLYDSARSVLWKEMNGDCLAVLTNGLVIQQVEVVSTYERGTVSRLQSIGAYGSPPTPRLVSTTRVPGAKLFIRNYPLTLLPKAGQKVAVRAMHVGTFRWGGEEIEMWDYGLPDRGRVVEAPPPNPAAEADKKAKQAAAVFEFYRAGAEGGDAGSQFRLGELYRDGKGVDRDVTKACLWFRKAAAQGDKAATAALADCQAADATKQ